MIFAEYKNDDAAKTFSISFANVEVKTDGWKHVNATYHLENAVNKAFDETRPDKFIVSIADKHNYYLKLIAIAFVAYLRGLGFSNYDIETINF